MRNLLIISLFFSISAQAGSLNPNGLWSQVEKYGRKNIKDQVKRNDTVKILKFLDQIKPKSRSALSYYWKKRLKKAIKKPVNCKKKIVLFRGVSKYKMIKGYNDFQFSEYLVPWDKNLKNIEYKNRINHFDKDFNDGKLQVSVWRHASSSRNSPYISFTTDLRVANKFSGRNKIGVYLVDPRRVMWSHSKHFGEKEMTIPLFTLKDELVGYMDRLKWDWDRWPIKSTRRVEQMIREKCEKHPLAAKKDLTEREIESVTRAERTKEAIAKQMKHKFFENQATYQKRAKWQRNKLLLGCLCRDPKAPNKNAY